MINKDRIEDFKKSYTYKLMLKNNPLIIEKDIITYLKGLDELIENCMYIGALK